MFRFSVNLEFESFSQLFKNRYIIKKYFEIKATHDEIKKILNIKALLLKTIFN
ncbi:hypothetical protein QLQ80_03025 [Mycoplasma sp. M5725]|uniref:Uncharacterized protein n=1 Tax=Mycoplasma phocimorsus TaxID=3045839 RepID=A0AAJ1PSK0_9MOLU|nr:hypothetical protein [Mycoplasma phocimorsus]MDJ1646036.1 hypothetical protein [Mycoplasma phocimorsus]